MTEKLNMDDADNGLEVEYTSPDEDFLAFEALEEDTSGDREEYPEYDTSRAGDKEYEDVEIRAGAKTLVIRHDQWGTLWTVHFKEGGELPKSLKGKFTDAQEAVMACNLYLASKTEE